MERKIAASVIYILCLAVLGVRAENPTGQETDPLRMVIILILVSTLLAVAAVIICKFACVNFCHKEGGYKKISEEDNGSELEDVKVVPVNPEPEPPVQEIDEDSDVKQPLPPDTPDTISNQSDDREEPSTKEQAETVAKQLPRDDNDEAVSGGDSSPEMPPVELWPPRYSKVVKLPSYADDEKNEGNEEENATPDEPAAPPTPFADNDKNIDADFAEKSLAQVNVPELRVETCEPVRASSEEPQASPSTDDELLDSESTGSPTDISNGSPPPPYADANSRAGSQDPLDSRTGSQDLLEEVDEEIEAPTESSPEALNSLDYDDCPSSPVRTSSPDEDGNQSDVSSDSDNLNVGDIHNAPTLQRPHLLSVDEPDSTRRDSSASPVNDDSLMAELGAAPLPADQYSDEEEPTASPTVPLDPIIQISNSSDDLDDSFEMDDYQALPQHISSPRRLSPKSSTNYTNTI